MSTEVTLKLYVNEDDALLFWSVPGPIAGCRGFAIERRREDPKGKTSQDFLPNRMGFENEPPPARPVAGEEQVTKPSTDWPFQRFSWTDHDVNRGDTVSYRVVPVVRGANGKLAPLASAASAWSPKKTLGEAATGRFRPFFNRGFVMSQFMARYLGEHKLSLAEFKKGIGVHEDRTMRQFLSGDLRLALLAELAEAKKGGEIFAALYELSDDELIDALCALGKRAHVVLANGSVQKKEGETAAQARKRDENKEARKRLMQANVDVERGNRFISPGALGHNKFLVRTDKSGKAVTAWTGSTNWTPTGLCTQVNNGLLIADKRVADAYLCQWRRLREAKSAFPKELVTENCCPKQIDDASGKMRCTVWFSRTSGQGDLEALRAEVRRAKQGVLFLMFQPGGTGLLKDVTDLSANPKLYVRGVVSTLPPKAKDESTVNVELVSGTERRKLKLDIVQPQGTKRGCAWLVEEATRKQFLSDVGFAIIHSKVVVIDPFSADPVVITGSHNFSKGASTQNDENFVIIKGDRKLAEAYAVNIAGAYAHYRWRSYLGETKQPFNGLHDNDKWLVSMLAADQKELGFWGL